MSSASTPQQIFPSSSSAPLPKDWKNLFASQPLVSNEFTSSITHYPTENATAHFTSAQFSAGSTEWALSLVGYSIGKRSYYEALLSTIKKAWSLKGSLTLLTLDEGFFLLKFNNREDFDMAWSGGPWFFFGKPFILQKWTPEFVPVREEFPSIPIWIKIKNFPLACWTPDSISRIASCVKIPLAVDALTAAKTRLTFARVCVQVCSSSPLPDVIYYTVDDKTFPLTVQYDWKPTHCNFCNSIMHAPNTCPKNPNPHLSEPNHTRGRSTSRKPRNPPPKLSIPKPPRFLTPQPSVLPPPPPTLPPPIIGPIPTPPSTAPPSSSTEATSSIPNLNSPSEDFGPSSHTISNIIPTPNVQFPQPVSIKNKFEALSQQEMQNDNSSLLIASSHASETGIRDKPPDTTKTPSASTNNQPNIPCPQTPWFNTTHSVFSSEASYNNFEYASPRRIWIKWNAATTLIAVGLNMRTGGTLLSNSKVLDFNNMIFNVAAHDLASVGHYFTWFNQRTDNPIHIKLDRMLVNDSWLSYFPNSFYLVDSPQISYHSPIILQHDQAHQLKHRFLFKNYWLHNNEFWDSLILVFSQRLRSSPIHAFYQKLKTLKINIKSKSWASSNTLQHDISELNIKQNSFLCQIQASPLDPEINLALKDINCKLAVKTSDWSDWIYQRAKANWMTNGEDDLKFLYSRINVRHNSNLIRSITTVEGTYNTKIEISNAIVNHFQNLFNTTQPPNSTNRIAPIHLKLPLDAIPQLVTPITIEEIKTALFSSPNSSAPGPDGYTFEFYKTSWNTIGRQLCEAVLAFFSTGSLPKHAKATAIALIPKRPHAQDISDYRPISLCNTFYKIIAKILANRLKDVMPLIIHPSQAGFIKDRIISDNILLAADLLKDFNSKHHQGFFCAKFDIHKAFDKVSREFIIDRLLAKGFPETFVTWIRGCISDVYFSVSINGRAALSPYLFCIAMDCLSSCFDDAITNHTLSGMEVGHISISHLLYADDLLVFAKANQDNAHCLNTILSSFANFSGLRVNSSKSKILFSKNSCLDQDISNILNIPISTAPINYLGIPIFTRKLKICDFQPLIHKISVSLDGWKARTLSMAGRLQFLNYTINNIILYWVRGTLIPKTCIKKIKSLCSRFLYYGDINKRKLHMISWKETCKPKIYGGLGIPSIEALYFACGCTVVWRFYNSKSYLFSWWKEKYGSFWNTKITKSSFYWKALCDVAKSLQHSLNFKIILNSNLSFFWDPWCFGLTVADRLEQANLYSSISPSTTNSKVSWFISTDSWNSTLPVPSNLDVLIRSIPIANDTDECCWTKPYKPSFKAFIMQFFEGAEKVSWMSSMLLRPNLWQVFCEIGEQETDKILTSYLYITISAMVYFLWKARNDRLFGNTNESTETIIFKIKRAVADWLPLGWLSLATRGSLGVLKDDDDSNRFIYFPLEGFFCSTLTL
ncbi:hypothetical protein KFK09_008154 [Dendrobium nobile]|uniref:Reverse transcriptase domain-containing protein n=1 Tax=Dendrobium nobile TaxID=94219 RepID=A0A8T3BP55_DENNO|nr:hypothetical protein KFK09_008154 [Dendrobium nobile]